MKLSITTMSAFLCVILSFEHINAENPELKCWKCIDDVRKFCDYVEEHGEDAQDIDENIVQNTEKALENNKGEKLAVFTKAMLSVSVVPISTEAGSIVKKMVDHQKDITFVTSDGKSLKIDDSFKMFDVKLAWLLWLSQTEGQAGIKLIDGYELYPVSVAKEYLENQRNGAKEIAEKILEVIKNAQKED